MKNLVVWLLVVVGVAGCGSSVSVGPQEEIREEKYINGKKVSEFYRQFLYKKVEGEDLPYRYLSNSFTKLKAIDAKKSLYFTASIFLLDGGQYVLDYSEATGEKSDDGFMSMTTTFTQRYKGTWAIDDMAIILDSHAKGVGFLSDEKDALSLTFKAPFNAPELKDKADVFYYTSSTQGLD